MCREKLQDFARGRRNITSDEKVQAQIFLDCLIQAFGQLTAPGVPKNYPDAKKLVTEDCTRSQMQ